MLQPISILSDLFKSPQSGRSTKSGAKRTEFAHDDPHAVASTVLQNFSYSDEDCLAKYKALSTLQDFNGAFPGNLQEKLIRGALKANEGSLPCFLCQKVLSSSVGLVLHIKKCQGSPEAEKVDVTPPKPVRPSLVPKRRLTISVSSLEQLKDEPSLWLRINEKEKLNLLKQFFPDGRIECFAIHKDDEICSLFFDYKEAITHLDSSIKPMYLTFVVSFPTS
ncbi:hypothetical protein NECAME_09499 [Necator americanus]|uniref:Uncharacterized protein n=1 Tax=Necator americanus TaxID=51031 RepID=W2TDM4_NECAM|nr:hypothetical protein NECAME_09499 [Necator americanus]ETN79928.1 hypothetical protein NECAME_09499 [Necator americanus]